MKEATIKYTKEMIIGQVNKCPSGALSYLADNFTAENNMQNVKIQISAGGPLLVEGTCTIVNKDGKEELKDGKFALCRCGQSNKKPYCDGSHCNTTFDN